MTGKLVQTARLRFFISCFKDAGARALVLRPLPSAVSAAVAAGEVRWAPVSRSRPAGLYLLPSGDRQRLLGAGQWVGDLGDGFLPRAGQAFRSADIHHPEGGGRRLGTVAGGRVLAGGRASSGGPGETGLRSAPVGPDGSSVSSTPESADPQRAGAQRRK